MLRLQQDRKVSAYTALAAATLGVAALATSVRPARAATVYFVGQNSSATADDNFDDASADTNFNTTDTQPGTTNYADGDAVIFSDKFGAASSAPLTITVNAPTAGGTAISPASVTFEADGGSAATAAYQFTDGTATGGIGGTGAVTLASNFEGFVQFNSANTYSGGTVVDGGTLHSSNANLPQTGTVTIGGTGTFQSASNAVYLTTQSFVETAGSTGGTISDGGGNPVYNGSIGSSAGATATGTVLNFVETSSGLTVSTNTLSGFTGTIELNSFGTGNLRLNYDSVNSAAGSANAIFDFGSSSATILAYNGGGSGSGAYTGAIPLGALEGTGTTGTLGAAHHSGTTYYSIGGLGLNTTFAGAITNGQAEPFGGIYIVGGSLTLTGNSNNFGGNAGGEDNIIGGALYANNTTAGASATGANPIQVVNNVATGSVGTLGGTGYISGLVNINLNSSTAPTSSNNGTLYNGSTSTAISSVPTSFSTGGHLAPGVPSQFNTTSNSTTALQTGTLTLNGGLILNDYSNLDYTLGSSPLTGDDKISMGSAGVLTLPADDTLGQDVQVNYSFTGTPELNTPYTLISYTAADVNGSDVADWNSTGVPVGDAVTYTDTGSAITATFTAVPEPTTLSLLGIGAVGLLARRRRAVR